MTHVLFDESGLAAILPSRFGGLVSQWQRCNRALRDAAFPEMQAEAAPVPQRARPEATETIAVIPVHGAISRRSDSIFSELLGGTSLDTLSQQLAHARDEEQIKAIVLHVDSPGGGVYGIDEMAQAISELNKHKPVIAFADGLAASAAYWLIAGASHIVATPSAELGSIGVYAVHFDESRMLDQFGVTPTLIKAGEFKAEANPYQPLSDEDRAAMQSRIDTHYNRFLTRVARGRGISASKVRDTFGKGRVLDAVQAEAVGMATAIGGWPDVVRLAITESRSRTHTTQQQPRPRVASLASLRLQLALAEAAL